MPPSCPRCCRESRLGWPGRQLPAWPRESGIRAVAAGWGGTVWCGRGGGVARCHSSSSSNSRNRHARDWCRITNAAARENGRAGSPHMVQNRTLWRGGEAKRTWRGSAHCVATHWGTIRVGWGERRRYCVSKSHDSIARVAQRTARCLLQGFRASVAPFRTPAPLHRGNGAFAAAAAPRARPRHAGMTGSLTMTVSTRCVGRAASPACVLRLPRAVLVLRQDATAPRLSLASEQRTVAAVSDVRRPQSLRAPLCVVGSTRNW